LRGNIESMKVGGGGRERQGRERGGKEEGCGGGELDERKRV
jgi:hypothetical protein